MMGLMLSRAMSLSLGGGQSGGPRPPAGSAFVTTTDSNGTQRFVTTANAQGNQVRVTTLKAA